MASSCRLGLLALSLSFPLGACGAPSAEEPAVAATAGQEQSTASTASGDEQEVAGEPAGLVDPVVASPDVFKVILDGPRARVLLGTWQPGQKDAVHSHPALTTYAITDVQGRFYDADGEPQDTSMKAGTAMFLDPVKAHQLENTGSAPVQLLLVEQRRWRA